MNYLSTFITVTDDDGTAAVKFPVSIDKENVALGGKIVAALYKNDGQLVESNFYNVAETVDISFSQKGDFLKVMQWDFDSLTPIADFRRIDINIDGTPAITEYSIFLDSRNVDLGGKIVAALYNNDGQLVESKFYNAEQTVDISFSRKGDYIKLMQWNMEGLMPLTDFHRIEIKD